jgi:hypothetical protein
MMRLLFATMLLLMFAGAAPAFELMGFGAGTCDAFLKAYRDDSSFEGRYYNWAQGFMSGVNIVAASGGDMKDLSAMTSAVPSRSRIVMVSLD